MLPGIYQSQLWPFENWTFGKLFLFDFITVLPKSEILILNDMLSLYKVKSNEIWEFHCI